MDVWGVWEECVVGAGVGLGGGLVVNWPVSAHFSSFPVLFAESTEVNRNFTDAGGLNRLR